MTAKEYLNQAYKLDQRINCKLEQVERLRVLTQRLTASYEGEAVSHTRNNGAMQDAIIRLIETEEELNREIDELIDLKAEITNVIEQVSNLDCKLLLQMRYLSFKSWNEIAKSLHVHIRSTYKIHGRALKDVGIIINDPQFESISKLGT